MDKMTTNPEKGRHGAPFQPHPPELKERGYRLYEQGKSNPEIAKELGIPVSTLARWSSKGKWKLRRQVAGRSETGPGVVAPTNQDALDEISQLTFEEKQARYGEMMAEHALRFAYTVKSLSPQGLIVNADKIKKLDETARKALNLEERKPRVVVNVGLLAQPLPPMPTRRAGDLPAPNLPIADGESRG
jgi:transposase-like protein